MCCHGRQAELRAADPLVALVDVEEGDLGRDGRGRLRPRPEGQPVRRVVHPRHEVRQRELRVKVFREGADDRDLHAVAAAVLGELGGDGDLHVALGRVPPAHRVRRRDVVVLGRLELHVEHEPLILRRALPDGGGAREEAEGGERGEAEERRRRAHCGPRARCWRRRAVRDGGGAERSAEGGDGPTRSRWVFRCAEVLYVGGGVAPVVRVWCGWGDCRAVWGVLYIYIGEEERTTPHTSLSRSPRRRRLSRREPKVSFSLFAPHPHTKNAKN